MQLLPKQDKKGASHNRRVVPTKHHLKKANYLRVQGYKDPVRQLSEVPKIRQRIAESLRKRRLKLQQLKKSKPNKGD